MLTKDMLRVRVAGDRVIPKFVKTDDPKLLGLARQLLDFYRPDRGLTRGEISESAEPVVKSCKDLKLASGLNKIIQDRCEFTHPAECDYAEIRRRLFAKSAEALRNAPDNIDFAGFKAQVMDGFESEADLDKDGVYADLPENEHLVNLKLLSPKELLERYNVSLVQSLLITCEKLTVRVASPEAGQLRKLFKYLKFFRLLAKIIPESETGDDELPSKLRLEIDGPASLFDNTQKYGLQLAVFFPAVCALSNWELKAEVKYKNSERILKLDQKTGLVSHYRNFSDYVPEEIAMFHSLFREKVPDWEIVGDSPAFNLGGGELIFPDLSFRHIHQGTIFHLELFHRWHSFPLLRRLEESGKLQKLPLLIGVDRFLSEKPETKSRLESNEWFEQRGFKFRDFPGVETVRRLLDKNLSESTGKAADQPEFEL